MELDEHIAKFLEEFSRERDLSPEKRIRYRLTLNRFKEVMSLPKTERMQARDFLDKDNCFIIESFLNFLGSRKKNLPRLFLENINTFAREIASRPVTPKDYDERTQTQTLQFQIDNYYKPEHSWHRERINRVLSALNPQAAEFILDVGCGVGTFVYQLALADSYAIGIDYSPESIHVARELTGRFGLNQDTSFVVADATILPFKAGVFDKIVCADFIEHINFLDKKLLLNEMCRVIKKGGLIVISTPNALREYLGSIKRWLSCLVKRKPVLKTRLHIGLTNRFKFEKMLRGKGFLFKCYYFDETRSILAKFPFLKEILGLHILWRVWK